MSDQLIFGVHASYMDSYNYRACDIVERHHRALTTPEIEGMLSEELQRFRIIHRSLPHGTPILIASKKWSVSTVIWDVPPINPQPIDPDNGNAEHLGAIIVNINCIPKDAPLSTQGISGGWTQCDLWAWRQSEEVAVNVGDTYFGGTLEAICQEITDAKHPTEIFDKMPIALAASARLATLRFYN